MSTDNDNETCEDTCSNKSGVGPGFRRDQVRPMGCHKHISKRAAALWWVILACILLIGVLASLGYI